MTPIHFSSTNLQPLYYLLFFFRYKLFVTLQFVILPTLFCCLLLLLYQHLSILILLFHQKILNNFYTITRSLGSLLSDSSGVMLSLFFSDIFSTSLLYSYFSILSRITSVHNNSISFLIYTTT